MKVGFKMGRDFICNRAFFFFFCKGCSKLNFYFCRSRILFVQNRIIQCHSVSPQFLKHCEPASTATDDQKVMCTKPFEQGPLEIQGCFPFSLLNAGELPCFSTFLATSSLGGSIQGRWRAIQKLGSAIMANTFLLEKQKHPGRKKMYSGLWHTTGLACFWAS